MAAKLNVQVLGLRWNQGLSWFPVWNRRESHKWIAVIRDPVARAISAKKSHGWTETESFLAAQSYAEKIDVLSVSRNFRLVYFEDLIADPVGQLGSVMEFLGLDPTDLTLDLVGQDGGPYRVESSDLVDRESRTLTAKLQASAEVLQQNIAAQAFIRNSLISHDMLSTRDTSRTFLHS